MNDVMTVAAYICDRYQREYDEKIDEMKLHKLMYFAQRESLIRTGEPLFQADFYGWRFGPVLKEIRAPYKEDSFAPGVTNDDLGGDKAILDEIFRDYAPKDAWSLSRLSHGEICWKRSRKGVSPYDSSDNMIPLDDIRLDADRVRERREQLKALDLTDGL